jgi:hypothetical protein
MKGDCRRIYTQKYEVRLGGKYLEKEEREKQSYFTTTSRELNLKLK